jgi:hypothetical protein
VTWVMRPNQPHIKQTTINYKVQYPINKMLKYEIIYIKKT